MKESDKFVQLHDTFRALFEKKDFKGVNDLMESFNNNESSVGTLKTILVISKSFKNNELIKDTRVQIVTLLENKLGEKLV